MTDVFAPQYGYDSSEIEIIETGARVGETFDENILTQREVSRTVENGSLYGVLPEQASENGYLSHNGIDGFEPVDDVVRSSEHADKLTRERIYQLLESEFEEIAQ